MKFTVLALEEALGLPLAHDLTQIDVEKGYKGARFRRGHIVTEADLETLRSMGREHLTLMELGPDEVHEDDAALRLAPVVAGRGVEVRGPREGKCVLIATGEGRIVKTGPAGPAPHPPRGGGGAPRHPPPPPRRGVLHYDARPLQSLNGQGQWIFATLPRHSPVRRGEQVAAFRILPLCVVDDEIRRAERTGRPIDVLPFRPLEVGLVTTGREIAQGRIKDAFGPKLERKVTALGGSLRGQRIVTDDRELIAEAIGAFIDEGVDLVVCTGGMSVDADDLTPEAIRSVADEVLFRGVPALPGSMLMLAAKGTAFVVGAPACVVHDERTTLDPLLQLLFAGVPPTEREIRLWGVGGLCRHCPVCVYPDCSFAARP